MPRNLFTHLRKECPQALGQCPPKPASGLYLARSRPTGPSSPTSPILPRMLVPKNVTVCCDGSRRRLIRSLEHVQVQLSLSYSRRGDLEIFLTSPMGTRSTLVAIRCEKSPRALGTSGVLPSLPQVGPYPVGLRRLR